MSRYCERDPAGWFAEPLNTVTGLAFFLSAWQAWKQLEPARWREQWDLHLLAVLIALVGATSVLWHASGLEWMLGFDSAATAGFVVLYWSVFLVRVRGLGWLGLLAGWLVTGFGLAVLVVLLPNVAPGHTMLYVPLLAMLLAGMPLAARVDRRLARDLLLASSLFALALVLRALDLALCTWLVVGTHWLWHLLTAGLLFILVDGMIRHVRLRERQGRSDAA